MAGVAAAIPAGSIAVAAPLMAAIPAVIIYNFLARSLASYRAELGDASSQVQRLVSRDLDRPSTGHGNVRSAASLMAAE